MFLEEIMRSFSIFNLLKYEGFSKVSNEAADGVPTSITFFASKTSSGCSKRVRNNNLTVPLIAKSFYVLLFYFLGYFTILVMWYARRRPPETLITASVVKLF